MADDASASLAAAFVVDATPDQAFALMLLARVEKLERELDLLRNPPPPPPLPPMSPQVKDLYDVLEKMESCDAETRAKNVLQRLKAQVPSKVYDYICGASAALVYSLVAFISSVRDAHFSWDRGAAMRLLGGYREADAEFVAWFKGVIKIE